MTQYNFISNDWQETPKRDYASPTREWVEGWNDGNHYGRQATNPYPIGTLEHHEWTDGWQAAMED